MGAPFLNIFDPHFDAVNEEVAAAREEHPWATTPGPPIVLRYEEVRGALRDSANWIHGAAGYMQAHGVTEGPTAEWWGGTLMSLGANAPVHKRVRDSVARAFTAPRVEDLRTTARKLAEQLVDERVTPGETVDFSASFTRRYPAFVMCALLGVPPEDFDQFSQGASDIGLAFSQQITPEQLSHIDEAVVHLSGYADDLIERLRAEPGDDLLSELIRHSDLSDDERHNLVVLLLWSGQDTTHCQLGRGMVAFSEHPDQWDLLAKQPDLIPQAIEEVVRFTPQARVGWRIATSDVEIGDLAVPANSMVWLNMAGANRDPRAFDAPDTFDVTAKHRSHHLGFSHGMHFCLGAHLARMEMAEAFAVLTERFEAPVVDGEIEWRAPQAAIHGPERLPLRLVPRGG
jgi:cytochrome P450